MPTFVALLRGINVGKAKRIPMAEFRALLRGLGYSDVATLLNSGNAVYRASDETPARHAADIADAIASRLKLDVQVIVKSSKELSAIVAGNALAARAPDPSRLLVAFVQYPKALPPLAVAIPPLVVPPERFFLGKHAAYLYCPNGILASKAGKALLGKAGTDATTRNWATVLKLAALASTTDAQATGRKEAARYAR